MNKKTLKYQNNKIKFQIEIKKMIYHNKKSGINCRFFKLVIMNNYKFDIQITKLMLKDKFLNGHNMNLKSLI